MDDVRSVMYNNISAGRRRADYCQLGSTCNLGLKQTLSDKR